MLSDAELRELEIKHLRLQIIRHEAELKKLLEEGRDDLTGTLILIIKLDRDRLVLLETKAADDLFTQLKGGDTNE